MYQRKIAYVFAYRNGIRVQSVGVLRRFGTADAPEVVLELFGREEQKKEWRIYYFDRREVLTEASFFWETVQGTGSSEMQKRQCRLCVEAGLGGGVLLLPEAVAKARTERFGWPESDEYLCARYDGSELTEQQLRKAFSRKPVVSTEENDCIRSAQKLVEEITKAAGGEVAEKVKKTKKRETIEPLKKKAEQNRIACLEELLLTKPAYTPCRERNLLYSVRILPEELLALPKEGRRYAENNFLLHGYYGYKHLLLGRRRQKEQEEYVLLVPGRYGKKDAQLASLFGFFEFLPAAGETAYAASGNGRFGYWCGKI